MESGDDVGSSEDEGDEGAAVTLERRMPTAVPIGGEHGTKTRGDALESRKHVVGKEATHEQEAKRARSSCPLVVSPVSSLPTMGATEQARRSEERACTRASLGPVSANDSQQEVAPPTAPVGTS